MRCWPLYSTGVTFVAANRPTPPAHGPAGLLPSAALFATLLLLTLLVMGWALFERRQAIMNEAARSASINAERVGEIIDGRLALAQQALAEANLLAREARLDGTAPDELSTRLRRRADMVDAIEAFVPLSDAMEGAPASLHLYPPRNDAGDPQDLMVARLSPESLDRILSAIRRAGGENLALLDAGMNLVSRYPAPSPGYSAAGLPLDLGPLEPLLARGKPVEGVVMISPVDGQRRLLSGYRLPTAPYVVLAGRTTRDILQPWWRELNILLAAWLITATLGGVALRRHHSVLAGRRQLAVEVRQRRAAQEASEQRERELRSVVSGIDALLFRFDHRGHIRFVHAPRDELLPAAPEQLLGSHFRQWLPPTVSDRLADALDRLRASGAPVEVVYRLELGGILRDFKAALRPLDGGAGEPASAVVLVTDITRETAREAQLKIAALAFETHLGMFITDAEGRVLKTNATFSRITGYSEAEVRGRNPRLWSSGRHDADFYRRLWRTLAQEGRWQGEIWNRRKSGELYPQWLTISAVRSDDHELLHYVATLSDLSEAKAAETTIRRLSFQDSLTGLPNRRRLNEQLQALEDTPADHTCALLLLGLDNFKAYNNALGHERGDMLLRHVAEALSGAAPDRSRLARWGGDQFALLVSHLNPRPQEARRELEQLGDTLRLLVSACGSAGESSLPVAASIGAALFHPGDGAALESPHRAELAMYHAKREGGDALRFFDTGMQTRMTERTLLEAQLSRALERQELRLHYQVQVDAQGRAIGYEALLRWQHGERGSISPGDFIPVAEESLLIITIGRWVLETACRQLAAWADAPHLESLTLSVNVSPVQFAQPGFVEEVTRALQASGANPRRLVLEVTEGLFLQDPQVIRHKMKALTALGVRFAIDDFGTGYSSLTYLKELPLHELKIDQAFVRDLLDSSANAAIVKAIIALADALRLSVTAEGVETEAQRDWLQQHGCQHYQGYLFGRPLPEAELQLQPSHP